MPGRSIGVAKFKAQCLRLIDEAEKTQTPLTITKRGKAVAVLLPMLQDRPPNQSIIGALASPGSHFDRPFDPIIAPEEWDSSQ